MSAATGPGGPLSPDALLALDDQQEFPADATAFLDAIGAAEFYADHPDGDVLRRLPALTALIRLLARQDLTLAVAHAKTYLGAACVWVAGDDAQRRRLATQVRDGAIVSWGLTERGHGGDLLAGQVHAEPSGDGWSLTGEKWLINNATRAQLICVLARTSREGGPRGFSLLLFDKRHAEPGTWHALPKVPTHGVRGADISGIGFTRAHLRSSALIGQPGTGLETTLKTLQLTRVAACGLSLGALEHALVLGADFARHRTLYGKRLAEVPNIRQMLGRCLATLHVAEAVTFAAARLAATATSEMAVASAVAKALVPELCQEAISAIGELLGLRGFLTADEPYRAFQKLDRDHRIVPIFDGSTAVCRSLLVEHFPLLARGAPTATWDNDLLAVPARSAHVSLLSLLSRRCSLTDQLGPLSELITIEAQAGRLPDRVPALAAAASAALEATRTRMARLSWEPHQVPQEAFDVARDFELCFAASASCHLWAHGQRDPGPASAPLLSSEWLGSALAVIEGKLPEQHRTGLTHGAAFDSLAQILLDARDDDRMPSLSCSGVTAI
ncbi:acyl-CoA dehydrogenase [Nonomuraea sp. NPDC049400]|uniref:acyl-CoA dehydrogenase n=1 Tax=Nonomuraea sp. NPDC049400 TaxID=3364352 RepID=UPI003797B963